MNSSTDSKTAEAPVDERYKEISWTWTTGCCTYTFCTYINIRLDILVAVIYLDSCSANLHSWTTPFVSWIALERTNYQQLPPALIGDFLQQQHVPQQTEQEQRQPEQQRQQQDVTQTDEG